MDQGRLILTGSYRETYVVLIRLGWLCAVGCGKHCGMTVATGPRVEERNDGDGGRNKLLRGQKSISAGAADANRYFENQAAMRRYSACEVRHAI